MRTLAHSAAAVTALVAAPFAAGALVVRPSWRSGLLERIGRVCADPGAVWVHAASAGEALAAIPLLDALREAGHSLVVSTQTLAGRETLRRIRPELCCRSPPCNE